MIIRTVEQLEGTRRETKAETWMSRRLLLKEDGMGFSMHETTIYEGTETRMWYKHHLEAVLCVKGIGEVVDLDTGETHRISPGIMYALDKHDRHILRANTEMKMICVFNPPVTGQEIHNDEGAYELAVDEVNS